MCSLPPQAWIAPVVESSPTDQAAIDHMALNGHSERLHHVFRSLSAGDQRRWGSSVVLRQAFVGGLAYLRQLPLGAAALRREQAAFLDGLVRQHAVACERDGAYGGEYFLSALEWCAQLFAEARLPEAEALCAQALARGGIAFPSLYPRLVLLQAALRSARGRVKTADAELQALYARRDLISDWKVYPEIVLALARTALLSGRYVSFKRLLFDGLRSFYPGLDERRAILDLLRRTYPGGRWILGEPSLGEKALLAAHWAFFGVYHRAGPARRLLARGFLGALYVRRYGWPQAGARSARLPGGSGREVLVTRAMGGVGDLLMMTPGLRALRERNRERVRLALPRRLFPVFAGNDDVLLLDIQDELHPSSYARWHNLTECPAARVESFTAPRVRRNRIEIFAHDLGIRGRRLRRLDRRPRYVLSESDRELQRVFFEKHGLDGQAVVAVQLRSDERYRDYAHMDGLVRELAREWRVIAFAERRPAGFDGGDAVVVEGRPLREAFAIAAGCAAFVAPDSAFVHLAGALAIPCVALFGPTDGKVRTADYPLCRPLDARRLLPCIPCWRNEDTPCNLTGMKTSVCLGAVEPAEVLTTLRGIMAARTPMDGQC